MTILAWSPRFTLIPSIARGLMQIEAARALVDHTPLSHAAEIELRSRARVRAAHFSTFIEGNRLTLEEARVVIADEQAEISGRERDVSEVRNYWNALLRVEDWARKKKPITEELIKRLHAFVENGPRAKPTPYRDGQNAIKNSVTGALIYLPPEAKDVPDLMAALVAWANEAEKSGLPVPLIAGIVHYQFVTIHPYYDGNGRTARLLATFILHKGGYGLGGFFSLEEHYARDLQSYYRALTTHPHHNYYFGRSEADLTPWLEYFISTLADVFETVRQKAQKCAENGTPTEAQCLAPPGSQSKCCTGPICQKGDHHSPRGGRRARPVWAHGQKPTKGLVEYGWLQVSNPSRRARAYSLSAKYRQYIGSLSAMPLEGENNVQ